MLPTESQFSKLMREAFWFVLISGTGWVLDLLVYTGLTEGAGLAPAYANFISSYAGLSFVYFTATRIAFRKQTQGRLTFLLAYWIYHLASITGYSALLGWVVVAIEPYSGSAHAAIAGKILITPFNLATNFIFMKLLTLKMRDMQHES